MVYAMIEALDHKDWVVCRSTFADEVYLDLDFSAVMPDQVKADEMITSWSTLFDQFATILHIVTNPQVECAVVRSYVTALHVGKESSQGVKHFTAYGTYEDQLIKVKDGWKIIYMCYRNRMAIPMETRAISSCFPAQGL
ncbi:MAG TPA: nuclear transport factor 2 family protein [Ktedonobacteraceae bacterium]|nr:nuclear transport factor 2 family protein [Ktedonobacteraceae bacterium]